MALLDEVIDAHGGLDAWRRIRTVDVRFNFSGGGLVVKGFPRHLQPVCSIDVAGCRVVSQRLGPDPDERWNFTRDRVWIERRDGEILQQRDQPRDSFVGHTWETKWDPLHLTYFIGYAIWNYVSTPFLFAEPGFEVRTLGEHSENGEIWQVVEVIYPDAVPAHTKVQKVYFGPDLLVRRLDYKTDVVGGVAAHYCFDHQKHEGIMMPTLRRVVSRTDDGPKVSGRTGFMLDYVDVQIRH